MKTDWFISPSDCTEKTRSHKCQYRVYVTAQLLFGSDAVLGAVFVFGFVVAAPRQRVEASEHADATAAGASLLVEFGGQKYEFPTMVAMFGDFVAASSTDCSPTSFNNMVNKFMTNEKSAYDDAKKLIGVETKGKAQLSAEESFKAYTIGSAPLLYAKLGLLAVNNYDHFMDNDCLQKLIKAGISQLDSYRSDKNKYIVALACLAHFVTDSFSGGHVRTPRKALLDGLSSLTAMTQSLKKVTAGSFAKTMHDTDNFNGVMITDGGETWLALGDKHWLDAANAKNREKTKKAVDVLLSDQTKPITYEDLHIPKLAALANQNQCPIFVKSCNGRLAPDDTTCASTEVWWWKDIDMSLLAFTNGWVRDSQTLARGSESCIYYPLQAFDFSKAIVADIGYKSDKKKIGDVPRRNELVMPLNTFVSCAFFGSGVGARKDKDPRNRPGSAMPPGATSTASLQPDTLRTPFSSPPTTSPSKNPGSAPGTGQL